MLGKYLDDVFSPANTAQRHKSLIALRADAGSVQNQSVLADLDIFGKTVAADFNIVRLFSGEKFF